VFSESLLQAQEGGLPGAVAGSDFIEFPFIFERIDQAVDVGHWRLDEVQAAENDVRVRVHGAGGLQNFLDAGVRAAIDQNQSVRSFDGESELGELESAAESWKRCTPEENPRSDFSEFIDEDEMARVVEFACAAVLGIAPSK